MWGGKNTFTFLVQDEIFWDDDVTPEGVAMGFPHQFGQSKWKIRPILGYFIMEATGSSNGFDQKSDVGVAQVFLDAGLDPVDLTFGSGFYMFRDNEQTLDVTLDDLDYTIAAFGVEASFKSKLPWSLGVDYMENVEDYPDTLFNEDQTTGYIFGASVGSLKEKSNWLIAWYYAHIEKFAVVARLAQDDWLRWSTAIDTRSSNYEGHEFRVAYAFRSAFNAMLRVYMVEGIELETPTAVELEDGMRARLDFNMSF